jgi:exo-beta-1,3-glucanase (GH17 family)
LKSLVKVLISVLVITVFLIACQSENVEKPKSPYVQNTSDLIEGEYKAIAYSGFREGQHPDRGEGANNPSYEETLEDLQILSHESNFRLIRLYDSGENSQMVLNVIKENNIDIKVMLGIWLRAEISNHEGCPWLTEPIPDEELKKNTQLNREEIETAIRLSNEYKNIISAVNVGNEALIEWNDHMVSEDSVIAYVKYVQENIEQPVTVADNFKWWADFGKQLAEVVDFVSIHVYPLWEGQDIDTGLAYSVGNYKEVIDSLPGKQIVITELGWATTASEFGERASEENQLRYYNDIYNWAEKNNVTTFFFEAFDEPWKGNPDNPNGAEKHWGIFFVDRTPKLVMKEMYKHLVN